MRGCNLILTFSSKQVLLYSYIDEYKLHILKQTKHSSHNSQSLNMRVTMKSIQLEVRKKYMNTVMAVAEGLWNGIVVSGVLIVSAMLIKCVWFV